MKWNRKQVAELSASAGVACIIAGYLRYSIQDELLLTAKILLILGGVLVLAGVVAGFGEIVGFFSKRSSKLGTNTSVLSLAVIAILVVLNVLGYQHHKRFDLTSEKLFTLSGQTKKIVSGLRSDVDIVRFAKQPNQQLDDLMNEYKNISSHVKFQNVDPQEKPEVAKDFGAEHMGDVIAAEGAHKQPIEAGPDGGFTEQDITSAILKVTRSQQKTVCFVTGHGEKSLSDTGASGYSVVDQGLKKEAYNTQPVNLVTSNGVPPDCDVLVIAGPTQAFFPQEEDMVEKYLNGGGKVLVEIDPEKDAKLDDLLKAWNVNLGSNVVVDISGVGRLFGTGPAVPLVVDYGDSPITKNLQNGMTFFPLARTVAIADKSRMDPQAVELLKTSDKSYTIPNLEQKEVKFDSKTDTPGPLSLGVAASKTEDARSDRLVVIGDSDFAANQWISLQHNGDLFYNTIDWLAQDENLISIRPKTATNRNVTLTESAATGLEWVDMFLLPGIVILTGIGIWWKRR